MRIISLLPSSTEIVYALGLQDELVGVSHECDYPAEARSKPVLIESVLGEEKHLPPGEIDRKIRETVHAGQSVYRFKPGALEQAKPELIITQGICEVCAVPYQFVVEEVRKIKGLNPQLISLDPQDLTGILTDIRRVGEAAGAVDQAGEIVDALEERVGEVAGRARSIAPDKRVRVAVIEWTDPLYAAGHWVPEMIELAGGTDVLAKTGEPSLVVEWEKVRAANPEVIVLAPCGYDIAMARAELKNLESRPGWKEIAAVKNGRVYLMNATATLSRPGPRIVDGLEDLAQLMHPDVFPVTGKARWEKA